MHTTEKYITEENTIDLIEFNEQGISILEIWVESLRNNSKRLVKQYELNEAGKIIHLKKFDDEWTAYPPLSFPATVEQEDAGFQYSERLIWNDSYQLEKVLIHDTSTNQKTERSYSYYNNKLVVIDDPGYQKEFVYTSKGELCEVNTSLNIASIHGQKISQLFKRDRLGRISQKITRLSFLSNSSPFEMTETFDYNDFGQLKSSIQQSENEGETTEILTTFEYINPRTNKFKSVKIQENGQFKSKYEYKYNSSNLLDSITAENSNELLTTKTIYIRS